MLNNPFKSISLEGFMADLLLKIKSLILRRMIRKLRIYQRCADIVKRLNMTIEKEHLKLIIKQNEH